MAALVLPRQPLATLWQALGGALWHAAECLAEDGVLWMGRRDRRTKKGKVKPARLPLAGSSLPGSVQCA
jgi:hypothetical protein